MLKTDGAVPAPEIILENDNFIFDLYGTLIDVHTDEHADKTWKQWIEYLDKKGIIHPELSVFREDFFELDRTYREKPTPFDVPEIDVLDVYAELFERYGNTAVARDELYEISYAFRTFSTDYIRLFPNVTEFLTALGKAGKRVFLLSNAQRSYTFPELLRFGLIPLFDDYMISSDCKCMKPDRAFFDKLILKNGLDRNKTVMFGDSPESDVKGAQNAGIKAVHLSGDSHPLRLYGELLKLLR